MMLESTLLYCTVLYCTVLYCTVLYCTVLYCTVLHCAVLYCIVLDCTGIKVFKSDKITNIGEEFVGPVGAVLYYTLAGDGAV